MKQRTPLLLNKSRWLAYSIASGASALTVPPAEGAIHYSGPINIEMGPNRNSHATFPLDQPGDSIFFERVLATHFSERAPLAGFKADGLRDGSFVGTGPDISTYCFIYNLNSGYDVTRARHRGRGADYRSGFGKLAFLSGSGNFGFAETAFIGFRFNNGSGQQYGWARVHMRGNQKNNTYRIIDYAYADVGETILTGQTEEEPSNDAEESLGALAFGAVGVVAWRQRRARAK